MSPASQGALEVERYIGSCLISSNVRSPGGHKIVAKKSPEQGLRGKPRCFAAQSYQQQLAIEQQQQSHQQQQQQGQLQYAPPAGWTGAPLISMVSSPRRSSQRSSPSPIGQQQQHQQVAGKEQVLPGHLQNGSPLSRLAIHTQGAPLVLAGRFHGRPKSMGNEGCMANPGPGPGHPGIGRCQPPRPLRPAMAGNEKKPLNPKDSPPGAKDPTPGPGNIANIDSLSIASDESSGSNNSENSLPRIIKPRKRRKKDRKPPNAGTEGVGMPVGGGPGGAKQQDEQGGMISDQSNVVTLKPYVPACFDRYEAVAAATHRGPHRRPPTVGRDGYGRVQTAQEIADTRQRYHHRHHHHHHHHHVQVKVLDGNRNVLPVNGNMIAGHAGVATAGHKFVAHHQHRPGQGTAAAAAAAAAAARLLHDLVEASGCDEEIADGLGSCQCRYCDPSGLIWDVDRNGYSPFLTPPPPPPPAQGDYGGARYQAAPMFLSRPPGHERAHRLELFEEAAVPSQPPPRPQHSDVLLRRSWSDPTSYFGEEILQPSRDVGVIGDRGQLDTTRGARSTWRGDNASALGVIPADQSFPSSPTTIPSQGLEVSTEIVTSPNGHRDLEIKFYSSSPSAAAHEDKAAFADGDDFADIWSYHESKLQQDFRTLLQAEE
ncbi:uncharacterized protein LOC111673920 [Orussus abietinus]|uniref:uncharacterized protein LOC111673920 n=1 Tax=Orussus abietinus TaxID=222816 RepID=UPI000C715DE3|nr:uncharacterized protein LOC111673920 [Orussus abietinus]